MAQNDGNWQKWSKLVEIGRNSKNGLKRFKIAKNDKFVSKLSKLG